MAPKCKMIILKVLDKEGNGSVEQSMKAFRWILENQEKYNIRIVNISMGMVPHGNKQGERYILTATELLWNMGMVVVAAAGNLGPKPGSVTVPGVSSKIITVGSYDTIQSGCGIVEEMIVKPDLVAPGNRVISCNAFWKQDQKPYIAKSGTSMSTPIVTGAAARLLSKEPNLTNTEVKKRLIQSCTKFQKREIRLGNGLLNVRQLMQESRK
jgi:serine protease AprX